MAYNNYYPYAQQQPNVIRDGGVINVQSEQEARDYLVAQGTSVTFINGNEQKLYVKTRGFSTLDKPTFKVYALVEEVNEETTPVIDYVEKREFEALKAEFAALKKGLGDTSD